MSTKRRTVAPRAASAAAMSTFTATTTTTKKQKKPQEEENTTTGAFDPYGVETQQCCTPADHASKGGKFGQKKNCLGNPLCVFGLGEFKTGIWGPNLEDVKCLRESGWLSEDKWKIRPDGTPAGLENLGATCYVNSLLQTLFHNKRFRELVYEWRGSAIGNGQHALALQRLFVSLEISTATSVDPTSFAKLLNLQTGVQQDAQEFNKLLLDHLSQVMTSRLTDMFRGELEYETRCRECGNASVRSAHFFELELPIKSETSVQSCLASMQRKEELTGDNRYMCERCGKKCDADRRIVLGELPEILNLQLMRFVFDPVALVKRKLKDAVEIPSELEVENSSGTKVVYNLEAVLYHRGPSAHSGHYVAEVLCHNAYPSSDGVWWTFNDDIVERKATAAPLETGEGRKKQKTQVSTSQAPSKDAYMLVYRRRPQVNAESQTAVKDVNNAPQELIEEIRRENEIRREKALEYKQKRELVESIVQRRKDLYTKAFIPEKAMKGAEAKERYWIPTEWLECWIAGEKGAPAAPSSTTKENPIVVDDGSPAVVSEEKSAVVVDVEAESDSKTMSETAMGEKMPVVASTQPPRLFQDPIAMSSYLCPHQKLAPVHAKTKMKLITGNAWQVITSSGDDADGDIFCDFVLTEKKSRCRDCSHSRADEFRGAQQEQTECLRLETILAQPQPTIPQNIQNAKGPELVWVSKKWLKSLRERNKAQLTALNEVLSVSAAGKRASKRQKAIGDFFDPSVEAVVEEPTDTDANADIKCEHGNVAPGKTLKRLMAAADFQVLVMLADRGRWQSGTTTLRFPDSAECTICQNESLEAKVEAKRERDGKEAFMRRSPLGPVLKEVLKRRHGHPGASATDFLAADELVVLPKKFVDSVRLFFESDGPTIIPLDCSSLSCEHSKVVVKPAAMSMLLSMGKSPFPAMLEDAPSSLSDESLGPESEFVTPLEYDALLQATHEFEDEEDEMTSSMPSSSAPPRLRIVGDHYESDPQFCTECISNATQRWEKARTVFTDKMIYVTRLVIGQAVPGAPSTVISNGGAGTARQRATTRASRQGNKRSPLCVSSTDTVFLVKMKIYQSTVGLKCEPSQIRLYHHGSLLESNEFTLEMAGIRAGDDLYYDTNGNEDDDLVGLVRETERGFTGTALVSGLPASSSSGSTGSPVVDLDKEKVAVNGQAAPEQIVHVIE